MKLKRWYVITNYGTMKIYADTQEEVQEMFKTDNILGILPCYDIEYLNHIDLIKSKSNVLGKYPGKQNGEVREIYQITLPDGILKIKLYAKDGEYYDFAEHQFMSNAATVFPSTRTFGNTKEVIDTYFLGTFKYIRYSYRKFGQPKLSKPKELKGVRQSFSTPFRPKHATASCFVVNNDLWIKHTDYFSLLFSPPPEDSDKPTTYLLKKYFGTNKDYLNRFVYDDCWGEIVLRSEAWIHLQHFKQVVNRDRHGSAAKTIYDEMINQDEVARVSLSREGGEYRGEWKRFWERLVEDYKAYINKNESDNKNKPEKCA